MKQLVLILLTIVGLQSCTSQKLSGTWIVADGRHGVGSIFEFDGYEMSIQKVNGEIADPETLKYQSGKLISKEEQVGFLSHKSDNQLNFTLLPDSSELELIPFPFYQIGVNVDQLNEKLKGSCWNIVTGQDPIRIDFEDAPVLGKDERLRSSLVHRPTLPSIESEYWIVSSYNQIPFVIISDFQMTNTILIPAAITEESIEADYIRYGENSRVELLKTTELSEEEKKERESLICSKKWTLNSYDTTYVSEIAIVAPTEDELDKFLQFTDLDYGPMSYDFIENGTVKIRIGEKVLKESQWELSSDGKFIWLNGKIDRHCIEIVNLDQDEFVMSRFEYIHALGERVIPEYLVVQTLN